MEKFAKILHPCDVKTYKRTSPVFIKIEFDGSRLSLSGVIGPRRNGDADGGCGQIEMEWRDKRYSSPPEVTAYAPGWTTESFNRLLDLWGRWHMNDTRAGCEHQRTAWDPSESIELVTYKLKGDVLVRQLDLQESAMKRLAKGEVVAYSPEETALVSLTYETHEPGELYEESKRETKTAGWVYPNEHPKGLLMKPCEVCGYKYGSKWLHEDVPAEVLDELRALPDTDQTPAWV